MSWLNICATKASPNGYLSSIDWGCFMLLDIGNSVIDQIPLNTRFAAGLFQAVAVRAAGFAIVPLNSLAPAVKSVLISRSLMNDLT